MSYTFFLAYTLGMLQERNNNSIMKQSLFDKLSNMAEALNQKGKKKKTVKIMLVADTNQRAEK